MSNHRSDRDMISEREFNAQMASSTTSREEDSPGDSEADAGSEFLMGMNYMPDEESEFGESGDEPGEIMFSDLPANSVKEKSRVVKKIPDSAKIVSSEQPEPWADLDTPSDTH